MPAAPHRPLSLAPGIECFAARTPTLPPATHTNSYALGEREVLLVEPAPSNHDEQAAWLAWAQALRQEGRRLVGILATHHHPDHVGGASVFATTLKLPLFAHPRTLRLLSGFRGDVRAIDDGEAFVLAGQAPQRWQVLHTPGHASGHLCLHEPTLGTLVVGDMVASVGTILIEPIDGNMTAYLHQLRRLESLRAHLALPAHGEAIAAPSDLFARYITHRLAREATILAALGALTSDGALLEQLVESVYADVPKEVWPLACQSLTAHLVKLEADGHVQRNRDGRYVACKQEGEHA